MGKRKKVFLRGEWMAFTMTFKLFAGSPVFKERNEFNEGCS